MKRRFSRFTFAALAVGALCLSLAMAAPGCANTAQGKLNQTEILYGGTIGELNELREAGKISEATYHADIAPSARAAYAGIKRARAELKAGNTSEIDVLLKSVNDSLLKLQPLRPSVQKSSSSSIQAAPPPPVQTAIVADPASIVLALAAAQRLLDAISKWVKGDDLTPEEQATIQAATDAAAADVDRLDPPQT